MMKHPRARKLKDFDRAVYDIVRTIPPGRVMTYGMVADSLGSKHLARAVGKALSRNPKPVSVPCHRVVRSNGRIGGYSHPLGIERKISLLSSEGVVVRAGRIDLNRYLAKQRSGSGRIRST